MRQAMRVTFALVTALLILGYLACDPNGFPVGLDSVALGDSSTGERIPDVRHVGDLKFENPIPDFNVLKDSKKLTDAISRPTSIWAFHGGGDGWDYAKYCDLDSSGTLYVAGRYDAAANYANSQISPVGNSDIFILKIFSSGVFSWVRSAGGSAFDTSMALSVRDANGVFVTGYAGPGSKFDAHQMSVGFSKKENYYLAQLNGAGKFTMLRSMSAKSDESQGREVAFDSKGNVYVAGQFKGTVQIGDTVLKAVSDVDVFLARYNSKGDFVWAHSIGGNGYDFGAGLALDIMDNIYLAVHTKGSASIKGFGKSIPVLSPVGIVVIKLDGALSIEWTTSILGNVYVSGELAVDASGNSWFTGYYLGANSTYGGVKIPPSTGAQPDMFIGMTDKKGVHKWVKTIKSPTSSDLATSIALDGKGNVYWAGSYGGTATLGACTFKSPKNSRDIFVLKMDYAGACKWALSIGGDGHDGGRACVAVDKVGHVYVAGSFQDKMTLGSKPLSSIGKSDVFVWKFKQP